MTADLHAYAAEVLDIKTTFAALGRIVTNHRGLLLLGSFLPGFSHEASFPDASAAQACAAELLTVHQAPAVWAEGPWLWVDVPEPWVGAR